MQRMTGFDAQFIYDERPEEPQHTLKLAFLAGSEAGPRSLADCRRQVADRLAELEPLRWRALRVPGDLHHPVWVEDPELDVAQHVRRVGLPEPGGRDELCEVVSQIASTPLDPGRPPWELWLVDGFEGSARVAVLKISHALLDGGAALGLLEGLAAPAAAPRPGALRPLPGPLRLLADALRDHARELPRALLRLVGASWRAARATRRAPRPERSVRVWRSPWTPFSGRLSRRRSFHYFSASLDSVRDTARALDASVNDVLLAAVAGGVHHYLRERGALPGLPTLGWMTAATREPEDAPNWGNRVTARPIDLPTQLADPLARLRAAGAAAAAAKADIRLRRGAQLEDWLRHLPPLLAKIPGRLARLALRLRPDLTGGVSVSNVRGPGEVVASGVGPILDLVSVGHMKFAAGLNVTAWSYAGRFNVALYACADAVPDLPSLSGAMAAELDSLAKTAAREAARVESAHE